MSVQPTFSAPVAATETTGRYIVTFRDDAVEEGLSFLRDQAGVTTVVNARDFAESALNPAELETDHTLVFPNLGIAVVTLENEALNRVSVAPGEDATILAVEPETMFYALGEGLDPEYLRGYRDASNHLYKAALDTGAGREIGQEEAAVTFVDDAQSTWGLKATKAITSRFTGKDIKVAVLDTGMDLNHPDFRGRTIISKSFVSGQAVQDGHGHGTHCIGTACGFKDRNGRRYGIAYQSTIYAGKVLSNQGSGSTSGIIAGMEWAIANGCQIISMSLGNTLATPSTAYTQVGDRALQRGCLIIAAAGNHGGNAPRPPFTVGQPANSPSIMAVAALDNRLGVASFSAWSGNALGANVDIAAPGVAVYSSLPQGQYASWNGTSMATPHVSGVAALYAQSTGARGSRLWQLLTSTALRLSLPANRVGSGLVQAPQ
jgi:subtilisin family serine protease